MTGVIGFVASAARRLLNREALESDVAELPAPCRPAAKGATDFPRPGDGGESAPWPLASCNEALDGAIANLQAAIETSGAVIRYDPLPVVAMAPGDLRGVFECLIGDALQHPSAAPLSIKVACEESRAWWRFSVGDNGQNIDPELWGCVFEPSRSPRAGASGPESGEALARCSEIIERRGGNMWVTSRPESGALFYFSIPKPWRPKSDWAPWNATGETSIIGQLAALSKAVGPQTSSPSNCVAPKTARTGDPVSR
jgi:hypothetical protein